MGAPRTLSRPASSLEMACHCAQLSEDYRGHETLVLDLRDVAPIFDFFVITTGSSNRQMKALAVEVDRAIEASGSRVLGVEGEGGDGSWLLHDYGDIVLHVFSPDARALYDLENLWANAPRVDWRAIVATDSVELA